MTQPISGQQAVNASSVLSSGTVSVDHLTPDSLFLYMQTRLDGIDAQANTAFEKQKRIEAVKKDIATIQNNYASLDTQVDKSSLTVEQTAAVAQALDNLSKTDPTLANKIREGMPAPFNRPGPSEELESNATRLRTEADTAQKTAEGAGTASSEGSAGGAQTGSASTAGTEASNAEDKAKAAEAIRDESKMTFVQLTQDKTNEIGKDQLAGLTTTLKNTVGQLDSSAQLEMIQLQQVMSARQTAIQLCTNLVSALGKSSEAIAANIGH